MLLYAAAHSSLNGVCGLPRLSYITMNYEDVLLPVQQENVT